jgi:hypothetical protein
MRPPPHRRMCGSTNCVTLHHPNEIDLNDAVPIAEFMLFKGVEFSEITSVVDKYVNSRAATDQIVNSAPDLAPVCHVDFSGYHAIAFNRVEVPNVDLGSRIQQLINDGSANALSSTGYNSRFATEIIRQRHVLLPPSLGCTI